MAENEEKRITVKVAYNYFQSGNWDRALEEYKKLIAIDPMDFLVHNMLAEIYSRKGDKTEAIREYLHAASLLRATNNMEKAVQAYGRVLKLDPQHVEAREKTEEVVKTRMVEANDLARRGLFKQALEVCERLDEKIPNHPLVQEALAEITKKKDEQAAAPATATLSSVRDLAGADASMKRDEVVKNLYAMAENYESKQSWDEAVEAYITILRFNPDDESARAKLHALYRNVTRQDKALEVWARIKSEDKRRLEHAKSQGQEQPPAEGGAGEAGAPPEEPNFTVPKRAEFGDLAEMERLRQEAESRLRRAVEDRRERDKTQRESQTPEAAAPAPAGSEAAEGEQDINVLTTQAHMYIQQNELIEAMRLCQHLLELDPQNQDVRGILQKIFERKKL
jgi:tetratricopeptide (TPR) repeat protein